MTTNMNELSMLHWQYIIVYQSTTLVLHRVNLFHYKNKLKKLAKEYKSDILFLKSKINNK